MNRFRWLALAALTLLLGGSFGAHTVAAQSTVYPPKGPCTYGFSFEYPADGVVPAYEACDITGVNDLTGATIVCPMDGMAFSVESWGCVFTGPGEGLNDGFHDSAGNIVPSQGECPAGFFVWPSPDNGLDHDICSKTPEDPGQDHGGSGKGVFPVIGPGYVANTNGDGVICRATPGGDKVTTLPEGAEVTELADGVDDGWQLVAYAAGSPSCYIDAQYLSDTPPSVNQTNANDASATEVPEAAQPPADATNNTPPINTNIGGDTMVATGNAQVTGLPNTGIGPMTLVTSPWPGILMIFTAIVAAVIGTFVLIVSGPKEKGGEL